MKFHFLGTCSGTEPMPGTHHSSFVLEIKDSLYWFEAGENCVHKACEMGLNVMNTVALFVSHGHIDHIGGMANLLSCFNKRNRQYGETLSRDNTLRLHFPDKPALLDAIKTVASMGIPHRFRFTLEEKTITDGILFEDENLRVTALHNTHLKETGETGWHAFSFLLEGEGKRIVFSGDVGKPEELLPLMPSGCDLLIMETGHHKVADVVSFAKNKGAKKLLFTHHGREILDHRAEMDTLCAKASEENGFIAHILSDGETEIL